MSRQTTQLMETLKQQLRSQNITYKELANHLSMSEANVKRMFSQNKLSLERLETICNLLHMDILQLAQSAQKQQHQITELTLELEKELMKDEKLLLVAQLCLSDWKFDEMLKRYQFTEHQLIQYLAKLDKVGFIELLPNNRIRKRVSPHFKWQSDGPIRRFFGEHIQSEFFNSRFDQPNEKVLFISGMLSDESNKNIQALIEELGTAYRQQLRQDKDLTLDEKKGTSLVVGLRNWELSVFNDLRR
ncbi:helix-turn-helix domain-containing protein [Kangiella shandongensis]|uniref:helix-turn-helix domain-containing protein n=1 Tax=Kangiella shandongensis TaxID=2763258 RepID=UPI001CBF218D|nr:helix-turn-helix transcriptional regulator [Kangiella shandongensis]